MTETAFDPALYFLDSVMRHKPGCTEPGNELVPGKSGDPMQRCTKCREWRVARLRDPKARRDALMAKMAAQIMPDAEPEPDPEREADTPAPIVSQWVCREHLHPVTWKGTGCRKCDRR